MRQYTVTIDLWTGPNKTPNGSAPTVRLITPILAATAQQAEEIASRQLDGGTLTGLLAHCHLMNTRFKAKVDR